MSRRNELLKSLRISPLEDRLKMCRKMISKMCSEGRPPKMSIPVRWEDEDFFISNTISDALDILKAPAQPDPPDPESCQHAYSGNRCIDEMQRLRESPPEDGMDAGIAAGVDFIMDTRLGGE